MTNTYQVIGPPGTGKTTYLAEQATKAVNKYGSKSTMICSLTKAAAHEISGRGIPIADEMVGTLHAHCFRSLGCPDLAESNLKQWNEEFPGHKMSTGKTDINDSTEGVGSDKLNYVNVQRARMQDDTLWPGAIKKFYKDWCEWKESNGYMDFTDMIEACIENGGAAHGKPSILIGDEAQDWSKLEFKLFVDTWGAYADTVVLAADFDQSCYLFRGSDPHYFQDNPVPKENKKIREQSYRVPRAVHSRARRWIRRISNREDVEYRSTDREGSVSTPSISLRDPEQLVRELTDRTKDGKSCMVLVSCGYMLNQIIFTLKERGIPFANPYRKQQAAWNPLGRRNKATMPIDRVSAFLAPKLHPEEAWRTESMRIWTEDEFRAWVDPLPADIFVRGAKTEIAKPFFRLPEAFGQYNLLFKEEHDAHQSLFMDLEWYASKLTRKSSGPIRYACKVASSQGLEGITKAPLITIGTIHSVKGGEADSVFLFPDLSREGKESYEGSQESRDSIIRLFYVGMTRAKEELVLCQESSRLTVEF